MQIGAGRGCLIEEPVHTSGGGVWTDVDGRRRVHAFTSGDGREARAGRGHSGDRSVTCVTSAYESDKRALATGCNQW
jgi:hypothetical protein